MAAAKKTRAPKPVEEPCPICLDPYTGTVRKPIECPQCHEKTCSKCVEKYIMSVLEDPHCAHCRAAWNRPFLNTFCTQTFLNKTYAKYREDILINREKSYLPQYMVAAENEMNARKIEKEITKSYKRESEFRREMEARITAFDEERRALRVRASRLRNGAAADEKKEARKFVRRCPATDCKGFLSTAWKCGICSNWTCPDCFEVKGTEKDAAHTCRPEMLETANLLKKDTKPCPACGEVIMKVDGCFAADTPVLAYDGNIIMSQNIKVGDRLVGDDGELREVTDTVSGEDMLYEVRQIDAGITYIVNSKHMLVLKETSADEPIEFMVEDYLPIADTYLLHGYNARSSVLSRIAVKPVGRGTYYGWSVTGNKRFVLKDFTVVRNCDQMWCVSCHTPFSWKTGEIVKTGAIHNPHYYQWLHRGGGAAAQHPGHIPCGGYPDAWVLQRVLRKLPVVEMNDFYTIYRTCLHISEVERNRYAIHHQAQNTRDLGVKYLMKEITEEEWKAALAKDERDRLKSREIRDILDAFNGAAIDILRRIETSPDKPYERAEGLAVILQIREELEALRKYIVEELFKASKAFNCSVPYVDDDWMVRHGNVANIRRAEKAAAAAATAATSTALVVFAAPAAGGAGAPLDG